MDGSQLDSLTYQNERNAPSLPGTPGWQTLGYFVSDSGTLTVQLSNASQGTVAADAAMIQRIGGNGGGDDNFQLTSGSPAVAAGNPATLLGQEPASNGGRVNLGTYGGTALATASPPQVLQVLTPAPLAKLQIGQQATLTWQTGGLYAPANYYSGAIDGQWTAGLLPPGRGLRHDGRGFLRQRPECLLCGRRAVRPAAAPCSTTPTRP